MTQAMQQGTGPNRMLALAGLAAQILLENGAETYRVEDTVVRLCRSYGYPDADVIALSTGVLISILSPEGSASIIRRVRKRALDLSRVNAVNDLSRRVAGGGVDIAEALDALRAIEHTAGPSLWLSAALAGAVAASFALMFGGGVAELFVALCCGVLTQVLTQRARHADISLVLVSLVGGLVCSAVAMAATFLLHMTQAAVEITLAASIMPLISGLMMTNAVRDTLRGDLLSGLARGTEALLVAVMVALGISLLLQFYLPGEADVTVAEPVWYLAVLYAGIATAFFCPLLRIPGRAVLPASLLGAAAYGGYLLVRHLGGGEIAALFLAAAAVAFLCDVLARRMRMIATIFLCAALIPLVPGLGLYRTMQALLLGAYDTALSIGLQTVFAVGALALGAALGSLRIDRPERGRRA